MGLVVRGDFGFAPLHYEHAYGGKNPNAAIRRLERIIDMGVYLSVKSSSIFFKPAFVAFMHESEVDVPCLLLSYGLYFQDFIGKRFSLGDLT